MKVIYIAFSALCLAALAHCQEEQNATNTDGHGEPFTPEDHDKRSQPPHPTGSPRTGTFPPHHRPHPGDHDFSPGTPPEQPLHSAKHRHPYRHDGDKTGEPKDGTRDSDKRGGRKPHRHGDKDGGMNDERPGEEKSYGQEGGDKGHHDGDKHHGKSRTKKAIFAGFLILGSVLVIVGVFFAVRRYRRIQKQRRTTQQQGVTYSHFANDDASIQDIEAAPLATKEKL